MKEWEWLRAREKEEMRRHERDGEKGEEEKDRGRGETIWGIRVEEKENGEGTRDMRVGRMKGREKGLGEWGRE